MSVFSLNEAPSKSYERLLKKRPDINNSIIAEDLNISLTSVRNLRDDKVKPSSNIAKLFSAYYERETSILPKSVVNLRHSYDYYAAYPNVDFKQFLDDLFEPLLLNSIYLQPNCPPSLEVVGYLQLAAWMAFDRAFKLKEDIHHNATRSASYYNQLLNVLNRLTSSTHSLLTLQYCAELGRFAVHWNLYKNGFTFNSLSSLTQSITNEELIAKGIFVGEGTDNNPSAIRNALVAASVTQDQRTEYVLDLLINSDPDFAKRRYKPKWAKESLHLDDDLFWLRQQPYYPVKVRP